MTPLNLNGDATRAELDKVAQAPTKDPETELDLEATDFDGGTVRAELNSTGSYWSASAWYQWAKDKGRSYGAKVWFKF